MKGRAARLVEDTFESNFSEEKFIPFIKNFLNELDQDKSFSSDGSEIPAFYNQYVKRYKRIGQYTDPGGETLDVLSVNLKGETSLERARVMQRNFIGWYLKNAGSALVAFYHEDISDWRFSYVKKGYKSEKDKTGKIISKEELTPTRRFSFLVGQNEPSHTAQNQIVPILENDKENPTLSRIEDAFSVEAVTDEFYAKYRELSEKLTEALKKIENENSKVKADFENKKVNSGDFAKKLLNQVVFLYFLQKKGWLGVKVGEEWGSGSKSFLRELFDKDHCNYENFFNDVLEPLFYEALRHERADDDYYNKFKCKIPFLNGGLFDPVNDYNWVGTRILLPNDLFSNTCVTSQGDKGDGILDIFDRYNFTVKEDEPLEKEVAVDPEMLGKVFENFLEHKDKKSKGTFYTPREIVHYMCQESLIVYLSTEFGELADRSDFEKLIRYSEYIVENENSNKKTDRMPEAIRENAVLIDECLASIRVCDPAVGSGAFIVGMMNEITRTRNILTSYFRNAVEERTFYNFKREAIQNCLYGVDIDPSAVEIAKLRLWLSLTVDEKERQEIKPLPNLDYKIVEGNSLLGFFKNYNSARLEKALKETERLKEKFFEESRYGSKKNLKPKIEEMHAKLFQDAKSAIGYEVNFDFKMFFSEVFRKKSGFDLVIGNPPYVQLQKMKNNPAREIYKDPKMGYRTYDSKGDIYCLFYEKGVDIARSEGVLCYISSNKWMRACYGRKLRNFLLAWDPLILIDLGPDVFKAATVDTNILLVQKRLNSNSLKGLTLNKRDNSDIDDKIDKKSVKLSYRIDETWFVGSEKEANLKRKIERTGKPLKEWDISINYGMLIPE